MGDGTNIFYADNMPEYTESRIDEFMKSDCDRDFLWIPDDRTGHYYQLNKNHIMYVKLHYTDYDDGIYWAKPQSPLKVKRIPKIGGKK
jgi:hypothetical protein